jgi:hypothetical protein
VPRLYDISAGSITIDGKDIRSVSFTNLAILSVAPRNYLFDTIAATSAMRPIPSRNWRRQRADIHEITSPTAWTVVGRGVPALWRRSEDLDARVHLEDRSADPG